MQLALSEQKPYAPTTINLRLNAVRRLAYEAADSGLLSPELAAGIRRVKGVKQLGSRSGNSLNREQAQMLLEKADGKERTVPMPVWVKGAVDRGDHEVRGDR